LFCSRTVKTTDNETISIVGWLSVAVQGTAGYGWVTWTAIDRSSRR